MSGDTFADTYVVTYSASGKVQENVLTSVPVRKQLNSQQECQAIPLSIEHMICVNCVFNSLELFRKKKLLQ